MSFRQMPSVSTALSELGWNSYPIDDGNIVYSYDEFYMYVYMQHAFNRDLKGVYHEGSGTSPVALLTNENEWYIPYAPLLIKIGIIEKISDSVFTYTDTDVEKIFLNFVNYMKTVIPEKFVDFLKPFSIFIWLNNMQYSESIPKLVLDDNGLLKPFDEIFNSITVLNLLKSKHNLDDYCEEALKYDGLSEYFIDRLFDYRGISGLTLKTYVEEFNDFYNVHMINSDNWLVKTTIVKENGFQIRNVGFEYCIANKVDGKVFATAVALPSNRYNANRLHDLKWTVVGEQALNRAGLLETHPDSTYSTYAVYNCLRLMNSYVANSVPSHVKVDNALFSKIWNNNLVYEQNMLLR
mgnify:CR=1 FL=1